MNQFRYALAALLLAVASAPASALEIELGLNLLFNDPTDPESGGQWQVIAGSDNLGIHSLAFALSGVNSAVNRDAPFGAVNGTDGAGFSEFFTAAGSSGVSVIASHGPGPAEPGDEIGQFFGVGTLENGSPLFSGTAADANTVDGSPFITSLSGVFGVPWAAEGDIFGDSAFDTFAQIASGTFDPGSTPEFLVTPTNTFGTVFTSLGSDATVAGSFETANVQLLDPRDDLVTEPDFNADGLINAADYVVLRDTFGTSVPAGTGADADGSGVVDLADFELWSQAFVTAEPVSAVSAATAVPEPGAACLLLGCLLSCLASRRQPRP